MGNWEECWGWEVFEVEEEGEKKGRKAEGRMVVMSPRNWKNKTEKGRQKE